MPPLSSFELMQCEPLLRIVWLALWCVLGAGASALTLIWHLYRRTRLLSELSARDASRRVNEANELVRELSAIYVKGPELSLNDLLAETEGEWKRRSYPPRSSGRNTPR